jgi:hypothetical protein
MNGNYYVSTFLGWYWIQNVASSTRLDLGGGFLVLGYRYRMIF